MVATERLICASERQAAQSVLRQLVRFLRIKKRGAARHRISSAN